MENIFVDHPVTVKIINFNRKVINEILFVSSKKGKKGGVDFFNEINVSYTILDLFPEDSIKNLKEKIFLAVGLYPCEQCLLYKDQVIGSEISFDGEELKENIGGIPLNRALYQNRNDVKIYDVEYDSLSRIFDGKNFEIKCLSLKTAEMFPTEIADIELVYWSVVKYFPYFSFQAFIDYTKGVNRDKYPLLYPDKFIIEKKLKQQAKYLNDIYEMLEDPKSLNEFNISLIDGENNPKAELKFNINELYVLIQKRGAVINLFNLFTIFNTSEDIPVIIYNTRTTSFTKVHFMSESLIPLEIYKNKANSIYVYCKGIIFEIKLDGSIYAIILDNFTESIDFKKAEHYVDEASGYLFKALDNLKLMIFKHAEIMNYYEIIKISTTLTWFKIVNDFNRLLVEMANTNLVIRKKDKTYNRFIWTKSALTNIIPNWNEFAYFTDSEFDYLPLNYFDVENRYTELIVTTKNMTSDDFQNFMKFLVYVLKNTPVDTGDDIKKNNLKMLRILDPETYDFSRSKSDTVYARFCQKQKQPVPILPDDVKNYDKSRVLKFWNYTKQNELSFYCPNNNYPIAGFVTGHHPKGHCFVCCKKKKTLNSKYEQIHNICMEEKFYSSKKDLSRARYVVNYTKDLEPGRLSYLPSLLVKFITYNENDYNIISESRTLNIFRYNGKIYSIDRMFRITKNTKVQELPVGLFEEFLHKPVWRRKRKGENLIKPIEVLEGFENDRKLKKIYKKIQAADLNDPIFVYFDTIGNKYVIIDGFHRLAAAYLRKKSMIKVKILTYKQLSRCYVGKYSINDSSFLNEAIEVKKGGDDKEPFYYIYGIVQTFDNFNCSFLQCVASLFEMNVDCFIDDIIFRLAKIEYIGKYNAVDLKDQITSTFKNLKFLSKVDWNEVFEAILPILYNFAPIVLKYNTASDITLSLLHQSEHWDDVNFAIFIKNGDNYNPIYVVIPYIFSKTRMVEKRFFTNEDHIVNLFRVLCEKQMQDYEFTITKVTQMENYKITKVFSYGGIIYAVEVNDKIFVSVEQNKVSELSYDVLKIKNYKIKDAVEFLAEYSSLYGVNVNVHTIFMVDGEVRGYSISDVVNFVNGTLAEARKYWPDAKIETWNYDPATIINSKNNQEDPLYNKYMDLNEHREDYEYFKKNVFEKESIEKFLKKKPTTVFEQALFEEAQNPIKMKMMKEGIYNFRKFYLHKQKNENIYVRIK